jgi:hypothetical protein
MCALAAIRDPAAVVRKGGRVVVVEGGLGSWFVPDDCGVGEPGLEQRLAAAQEAWFWSEVGPAGAAVRTGRGGNVLLAEARLVDVTARSLPLDLPPPLAESTRRLVRAVWPVNRPGSMTGSAATAGRRRATARRRRSPGHHASLRRLRARSSHRPRRHRARLTVPSAIASSARPRGVRVAAPFKPSSAPTVFRIP